MWLYHGTTITALIEIIFDNQIIEPEKSIGLNLTSDIKIATKFANIRTQQMVILDKDNPTTFTGIERICNNSYGTDGVIIVFKRLELLANAVSHIEIHGSEEDEQLIVKCNDVKSLIHSIRPVIPHKLVRFCELLIQTQPKYLPVFEFIKSKIGT